jgi:NADH-quinone oxidoreductase subunit L
VDLSASLIPGPDYLGLTATIILWPLGTALFLLLFGKRLSSFNLGGREIPWAGVIAVLTLLRSFAAAVTMFVDLVGVELAEGAVGHGGAHVENARTFTVHMFDWMQVGGFTVGADFLIDQLSVVLALVVTGVGTLIALYSIGYMHHDPRFHRYFAYLSLFASAMLMLIFGDNLLVTFVGWEGVGLCSYLLIGFWFERPAAATAAKKAFIVNRIGDFSFLLGMFLLVGAVGTLKIEDINAAASGGEISGGIATIAALLLFGGAVGKSAQIPLYVWLPDAMEGPTPASALIHAATMVTAGVYMVARMGPVFLASEGDLALTVVAWTGALTALWAALIACTQYDIKRVLAYSTVSQLGYMFLANGLGAFSGGIFHLITHAFFKALMFMGAGSVMHALANETDMRKMGGLRKVMPITGATFLMGWLAISGIVPFAGFWSKDAILAVAWEQGEFALWGIGLFTALLTAYYMSRLYFRVFEGPLKHEPDVHPHESPWTMWVPLAVLGGLSVVGGAINLPWDLRLEHFLAPVLGEFEVPHGTTAWILAGVALCVAASGILLARFLFLTPRGAELRARLVEGSWLDKMLTASRNKFKVDEAYEATIQRPGHRFALFSAYTVDAKGIDGVVNGTGALIAWLSDGVRRLQSGYVRNYAALFLLGVVVLLSALILRVGPLG